MKSLRVGFVRVALLGMMLVMGSSLACGLYLPLEIAQVGGALHIRMDDFDFDNARASATVLNTLNISEGQQEVILDFDSVRATYGNWALNNIAALLGQQWVVPVTRNAMGYYQVSACSAWAGVNGDGTINGEFYPATSNREAAYIWQSLEALQDEVFAYIN